MGDPPIYTLQLNDLPLLVTAAIVGPLYNAAAIGGRSAIYVERLAAVAVGYFKIPKAHIYNTPLLVIAA